jgi:ubiquinone/menaquinone biosynthesis C-methylase UbiE
MTSTDTNDDHHYKASVHREWTAAAPGWRTWFDTLEADDAGRALTHVLVDRAQLRAGDAVLDFGTGYGEPGLTAARDVGPSGEVTCLDISGDMLAFAEARARAAGIINARFVEADIETVDLGPGSFDVVLSRAALMYASDPLATLRRLHTALRPGGRLAVGVWATPDKVAFAAPVAVMIEMLGIEPPAGGPGPFALGADGVLGALTRDADFIEVVSGTTLVVYKTQSPEACTQWVRDVAPPITELIADQPAAVQQEVWERVTRAWASFQGPDGTVQLPCTAVWAAAVKPS